MSVCVSPTAHLVPTSCVQVIPLTKWAPSASAPRPVYSQIPWAIGGAVLKHLHCHLLTHHPLPLSFLGLSVL